MTLLRVALSPLDSLDLASPLAFARLDRQGQIAEAGEASLAHLGQAHKGLVVECYLHPQDSLLASLELPALSPAKVRAAVDCAAQALILGGCESMHIVHGPRDTEGQVQIAWLQRAALERFGALLRQAGIKLRGLYPAAGCLPVIAGEPVVEALDEHLLIRLGTDRAEVHPDIDQALAQLLGRGEVLHWLGEPPVGHALVQALPANRRWSGPAPTWGLHGALRQPGAEGGHWGRALACCALAVVVWAVGLNLYAARQVEQGQQLKSWMVQRVKQAFPALPMVLNPLQQARQQLTQRQTAGDGDSDFSRLVQQSGLAMPFMVGGVQSLVFDNGELHLNTLPDIRKPGNGGTWQATLVQAGVLATPAPEGWTLRVQAEPIQPVAEAENE
ncbi:type II secretion system protein GspL [Pseudomonas gingeri]|uniref:type II secretion system protein GspL n=1 Tax=Pseudomonas gingeri TaxID=117681 RepID=UPI0015C00779|nr:type II secretion system protein GspL [Pseudomonas gingeri]NWD51859.1 type II secretion system protein GspL [Pseudomonas gingeri]